MKKIIIAVVAAVIGITPITAQETVKSLFEGERNVTWDNTLSFNAEDFSDVNAGNYINITFSATSDVIELKADGQKLPGTRYVWLGDNTPELNTYITYDMLELLRSHGLELCGANFTVSSVSIKNDGFNTYPQMIWGGYFWVDNWNTLELFKEAFNNYNGERYLDIYFSADAAGNTGYFIQVMTAFDNPDALWAGNEDIEHTEYRATVDLKDIDVKAKLENVDRILIQCNPEGGAPFNIVSVDLREENGPTLGVDMVETSYADNVIVYNLQGVKIRQAESAETALCNLPEGIYIVNGKKYAVK